MTERDARRWDAYERLMADSAASPSERAQAETQLQSLKARYPQGPPNSTFWREAQARAQAKATAEAAQWVRAEAVQQQRAKVEKIAVWAQDGMLRDLHSCTDAWSAEEQQMFKAARIRLTGSSRAVDL